MTTKIIKLIDSVAIECSCGARTAVGNLAKRGENQIIFVGGSYKHNHVKHSTGPVNEAKSLCLWCGKKWPENVQLVLMKVGIP